MKMAIDSCQAAKQIDNTAFGSIAESVLYSCVQDKTDAGEDPDEAWTDCQDDNKFATSIDSQATNYKNSGQLPLGKVSHSTSIAAAVVHDKGRHNHSAVFDRTFISTFQNANGSTTDVKSPVVTWAAPTLHVTDFLYGAPDAICIINTAADTTLKTGPCADNGVDLSKGFESRYMDKVNEILAARTSNPPQQLTDQQQQFVNASVIPIKKMIDDTKNIPGLLNSAMSVSSLLAALQMAYSTVMRYIQQVEQTSGFQAVESKKDMLDRIQNVRMEIYAELQRELQIFEGNVKSFELTAYYYSEVSRYTSSSSPRSRRSTEAVAARALSDRSNSMPPPSSEQPG